MKKQTFISLCQRVETAVGSSAFRSEQYLHSLLIGMEGSTAASTMYRNSLKFTGNYISGEWKVALTLRYLAGAMCLDLYLWSKISPDHIKNIVNDVIKNWICNDDVILVDYYKQVLYNNKNINIIKSTFAEKTEGIIGGCIGAVDGWLVKIFSPTVKEVPNPGKYYSRKSNYGLNVQVIVDKNKRVLWRYIGELGSSHDSSIFHQSKSGRYLEKEREWLKDRGLYLVGDSAYALRTYLLCPYDNAATGSPEDTFNYFLSSCHIYVECCFGEVDRRWGVLWSPLQGKLDKKKYVIDACLRLHNYIIDDRENTTSCDFEDEEFTEEEQQLLEEGRDEFLLNASSSGMGLLRSTGVNNGTSMGVDESNDEGELRLEGRLVRDDIRNELWRKGYRRPTSSTVVSSSENIVFEMSSDEEDDCNVFEA